MKNKKNQTLIIRDIKELRKLISSKRGEGKVIGLVPTMGALHEGHLSLVKEIKSKADFIITSIFVNPTQFGAGEDFDSYPKEEAEDIKKLQQLNVDCVFIPSVNEVYNEELKTKIILQDLTGVLCGATRPGHFDGVALIVMKLFMMVMPDFAIFGKKDYQQLVIIKKMVNDLNVPVQILEGEIVRQSNGLALSSRNSYLSDKEKLIASKLNKIIQEMVQAVRLGGNISNIIGTAKNKLIYEGFSKVDYLEVRESNNLKLIEHYSSQKCRVFAAAFIGKTRLIDNMEI